MADPQIPGPNAPTEPLLTTGGLVSLATAVVVLVAAFGLHLSADQRDAILGLIAVLAPPTVAVLGRPWVWSPKSVRALALRTAPPSRLPTTADKTIIDPR